jgi:tungstate transport system permease protein
VGFLLESVREAARLVATGDPEVFHALWVSLSCTLLALTIAFALAVPLGAWLALFRPRGHALLPFLLRVGMFTPTVVIGLVVFATLSRRGFLGSLDLLYTKLAIVVGLVLLAFPLLASLAHGAAKGLPPAAVETARTLGAGRWRAMWMALGEVRSTLGVAVLLAFARCVTELGIATTVGGNIRLHTRTLPGVTQLQLSMGNFAQALAPGFLLLVLAFVAGAVVSWIERARR